MFRRILKWTGLSILLLLVGVSVAAMFRQHLTYKAPYPNIKASTDTAVIAKGKDLVLFKKGCVHCHSPINNLDSIFKSGAVPSLAGARKMATPFGTFYTPNITPDPKTGIGNMTDGEIARMFRYGVKGNGEAVLPFMQGFDLSDAELTAVISYLRSVEPVESKVPASEFSFIGKFVKAYAVKPNLPARIPESLQ